MTNSFWKLLNDTSFNFGVYFLQVTHRCRLGLISVDPWIQTFLTIRAHYKQAGTNSENPGLEA